MGKSCQTANETAALTALLDARERRAARTAALTRAFPGCAVLSLLVNVPGPDKRLPAGDRVFEAGFTALVKTLTGAGIPVRHSEICRAETGCEARLAVVAAPLAVKRLAVALETSLPYGRLLDLDVPGPDGRPLPRTALGFPERCCMVCGTPGAACASRRLHPLSEILYAFERLAASAEDMP